MFVATVMVLIINLLLNLSILAVVYLDQRLGCAAPKFSNFFIEKVLIKALAGS